VFFVNVPIALVAVVGALRYVPESKDETARGFDVPGAVLVTGGLMALVYGLVQVNDDGVSTLVKTATFVAAVVLLGAFAVVQRRAASPLVPFRLFKSRSVLGADIGALLIGAGIFGIFFFLTLWMQVLNGYSPIEAGFAFLPMTLLIGVGRRSPPSCSAASAPAAAARRPDAVGAGLLLLALRLSRQLVPHGGPALARARRGRHGPGLRRAHQRRGRRGPAGRLRHRLGAAQRRPAGRWRARPGRAHRRQHGAHVRPAPGRRRRPRGPGGGARRLRPARPGLHGAGLRRRQRRLGARLRRRGGLPRRRALVAASLVRVSKEDAAKALKEGVAAG
jgi:hypothetical protein